MILYKLIQVQKYSVRHKTPCQFLLIYVDEFTVGLGPNPDQTVVGHHATLTRQGRIGQIPNNKRFF